MPSAETGHPNLLDDDEPFEGPAVLIGGYRVWFTYDSYMQPDALVIYLELGQPGTLDVVRALNLLLGLWSGRRWRGAGRGRTAPAVGATDLPVPLHAGRGPRHR